MLPMLKSNFPELVLFELRIYHVERGMNTGRRYTSVWMFLFSGIYIETMFKMETFRFALYLFFSCILKTYYSRTNRWKIRIHISENVRDRKKMKYDGIDIKYLFRKNIFFYLPSDYFHISLFPNRHNGSFMLPTNLFIYLFIETTFSEKIQFLSLISFFFNIFYNEILK